MQYLTYYRRDGPCIPVNCGSIPDTLLDSEVFGHEKGAFTGALARKRGRFERAEQGTILLDEIGEIPPEAQVRLLRVIRYLEKGDGVTRHMASRALAACGDTAVDPPIIALWSSNVDVRRYVVEALGHSGTPRAIQALVHILSLEAEEAHNDLLLLEKLRQLPQSSGMRFRPQ